jgi:hypothetical protein
MYEEGGAETEYYNLLECTAIVCFVRQVSLCTYDYVCFSVIFQIYIKLGILGGIVDH